MVPPPLPGETVPCYKTPAGIPRQRSFPKSCRHIQKVLPGEYHQSQPAPPDTALSPEAVPLPHIPEPDSRSAGPH